MLICSGSASIYLAKKIAHLSGAGFLHIQARRFPDGEIYVRVHGDVRGEEIAIVQSMYATPNDHLMEYLFIARNLRDMGAREIVGVIPYFPYARQDARFHEGEAVSLEIVAQLIAESGTGFLITVDTHLHRIEDLQEIFPVPVENLTSMRDLGLYVKNHLDFPEPIVIAPDEEAEQWAGTVASRIGSECHVLEKTRKDAETVEISGPTFKVRERNVLIVDDIISTGGTMAKTIERVFSSGARAVVAVCAHPLLIGDAVFKIFQAGAETILGTDTIPGPFSVVSVAPLISSELFAKS